MPPKTRPNTPQSTPSNLGKNLGKNLHNNMRHLSQTLRTWPLPAVLAWAMAWGLFRGVLQLGGAPVLALGLGCAVGLGFSWWGRTWWRRVWIASGFPLSLALSAGLAGQSTLPLWGWLVPVAVLLLIYPVHAWRDAPLFPTPSNALQDMPQHIALGAGARVLDAGCGAGDGLQALRRAYPQAQLHGLEFSWPLRWLCALRCPWASVRQGDIWRADWSGYDMVYLFQRPESMARAVQRAAQLRPGAWMVSLEFEASALVPSAHYVSASGKPVWMYQAPLRYR